MVTPIGLGSDVVENAELQDLLRMDAVDVVRPDINRWGITQIRKAAALAETYYVAVAPSHHGGPIATAAALHLAAAIPDGLGLGAKPNRDALEQYRVKGTY